MSNKIVPAWSRNLRVTNWRANNLDIDQAHDEQIAKGFAEHCVNAVVLFWFGEDVNYRHIIFDSVFYEDEGLGFDAVNARLKSIVDACHKYGIRVFEHHGVAYVHTQKRLANGLTEPVDMSQLTYNDTNLRDWAQISVLDQGVSEGVYEGYMFCPNNPLYLQGLAHYTDQVMATGVDGVMPDDIQLVPDWYVCGCKYCREKFKAETNYDLPENNDPEFFGNFRNPAFRAWLKFRMRSTGDAHEYLYKHILAQGHDDFTYFTCACDATTGLPVKAGGDYHEWIRGCSMVSQEVVRWSLYYYNWPMDGAEAMIRKALGRQHDVPQVMYFYPKLKEEFFFCWALAKIWGQNYWGDYEKFWWQNDPTKVEIAYPWEGTHEEYLADIFTWEAEHEDLFAVRDDVFCDVAILFSKNSRDALSAEDAYYQQEWLGWTQLLMRNNILFEQVLDSDLIAEKLEKYRLLILPNAACLSTEQVQAIKAFVANGGSIIGTYETSLYDEQGDRSADFALADTFGVHYVRQIPDINLPIVMHSGTAIEHCAALKESGKLFPASTSLTIKAQQDVEVHAHLDTYNPSFEAPSITVHKHGAGKAIYFGCKPGLSAYTVYVKSRSYQGEKTFYFEDNRLQEIEKIMLAAIDHALSGEYKIETDIPNNLIISAFYNQQSIVMQLLNATGTEWKNGEKLERYEIIYPKLPQMQYTISMKLDHAPKAVMLYNPQYTSDVPVEFIYENGVLRMVLLAQMIERYAALEIKQK